MRIAQAAINALQFQRYALQLRRCEAELWLYALQFRRSAAECQLNAKECELSAMKLSRYAAYFL